MTELSQITQLVSDYITKKYKGKIAIVALYGSNVLGTQSKFSDVDMFAITDDDTQEFEKYFIYNDHPVDLWSMSWDKAEKIAKGENQQSPWCVAASLFIHNNILYSRSKEDSEKFSNLRAIIEQT